MDINFSFIIPVYNRPNEVEELLQSLVEQDYKLGYEVVIVEDGSDISSKEVVGKFTSQLNIAYYFKSNSGPGASRNYGMERAKGNYFIILDSDCILPPSYLKTVHGYLNDNYVHCYGGPDAAHHSFSNVQKAINYTMTSFFTTGGIRGNKKNIGEFQPRSFNMGLSKEVFENVGGYGKIHPGEDPDLTFRIWEAGYRTALISDAFVYHKRRIDWRKFYNQVHKFGQVRPILNLWHPQTAKITYWFPTLFCLGFITSLFLFGVGVALPLLCVLLYVIIIFLDAFMKTKSIFIAGLSLIALVIQFYGYGAGFLASTLKLKSSTKTPQQLFPHLFFK